MGGDTTPGGQAEGKGCWWGGHWGPEPGLGPKHSSRPLPAVGVGPPQTWPGRCGTEAAFALQSEAPGAEAGIGVVSFLSNSSLVTLRSDTLILPWESSPHPLQLPGSTLSSDSGLRLDLRVQAGCACAHTQGYRPFLASRRCTRACKVMSVRGELCP